MKALRFRRANDRDADAISALVVPLVEKYIVYPFEPSAASRLLDSMTAAAFAKRIIGGYRYHVAVDGDAIVGVVATKDDSHLYHLFVAESVQRHGVATALWDLARRASREAGYEGDFTVNASRYAEGFYRKLGFERVRSATQDGIAHVEMRLPAGTERR